MPAPLTVEWFWSWNIVSWGIRSLLRPFVTGPLLFVQYTICSRNVYAADVRHSCIFNSFPYAYFVHSPSFGAHRYSDRTDSIWIIGYKSLPWYPLARNCAIILLYVRKFIHTWQSMARLLLEWLTVPVVSPFNYWPCNSSNSSKKSTHAPRSH